MASGTRLEIRYKDANDSVFKQSWKYANPSATSSKVSALVTATIANGSIFNKVPTAFKDAKIVTTAETPINVNIEELRRAGIICVDNQEATEDEILEEEQNLIDNVEAMRTILFSDTFKALREEAEKAQKINPNMAEITA